MLQINHPISKQKLLDNTSNFHICETHSNVFKQGQSQYLSLRDTILVYSQNPNTTSNHDTNPIFQHVECSAWSTNIVEKPMQKRPYMISDKTVKPIQMRFEQHVAIYIKSH